MPLCATDLAALSRLFDQATERGEVDLEDWLAALPPADQPLVPALRRMLAKHGADGAAGFLDALPDMPADAPGRTGMPAEGDLVGPYRLLRPIGQGGMGSVWLAERADGSFKRQVALKLPRIAWGAGLAERMAREREIGALLEHPHIARLYDAGVDAQGRPYMALEYIDGVAIDHWCQQHGLPVRDRLKLLVQVARAVAYAHGRLVVHRDLKPSNVLVSADGQAHLLDFGIAKLLDDAAGAQDGLTQDQGRMLTPHYASPEQLRGEPVTVQSDVYSLGVMAYELLAGCTPYNPKRKTLGALEEAILQGEPPPPSSRVVDKAWVRALRGDIDAIVGKALKREPQDRYVTADALAADIERHLNGEMVTARPDSAAYRLRKAVRRHWMGVSASAAVLIASLAGAGISTVQAQRAARAAERERVVKEFVADVFRINVAAPTRPGELRSAPAEAFLERSANLVRERFAGRADLQAELYAVVGKVFGDMGAYRLAGEYGVRRTEALGTAGASPTEQAKAYLDLAENLLLDRQPDDAEQRARHALSLTNGEPDLSLAAGLLVAQALLDRGKAEAADAELAKVEARLPSRPNEGGTLAAHALRTRASLLGTKNRRSEAVPLYDAAIAKAIAVEGPESVLAARIRLDAAHALKSTVDPAPSSRYFEAGVRTLRATNASMQVLAAFETARFAAGQYLAFGHIAFDEARTAIASSRLEIAVAGNPIPTELADELDLLEGGVLSAWGHVEAAMPLIERSAVRAYKGSKVPLYRLRAASAYGMVLMTTGEHEQADFWLRERLKARVDQGRGNHPYAAFDHYLIAENLYMSGRMDEALRTLANAPRFEPIDAEGTRNADRYNLVLQRLASEIELSRGNLGRASSLFPRALLDESDSRPRGDDANSREVWGRIQCASGFAVGGLRELRVVIERIAPSGYEHSPHLASTRAEAGLCALMADDRPAAVAFARQARAAFNAQPRVSDFYKRPLLELEAKLRSQPEAKARRGRRPSS